MPWLAVIVVLVKINSIWVVLLNENVRKRISNTVEYLIGLLNMGDSFQSELGNALDARANYDKAPRPKAM